LLLQYLAFTSTDASSISRPSSAWSNLFSDSAATSSSARRGSVVVKYLCRKLPTAIEGRVVPKTNQASEMRMNWTMA
jgi:hypothetical protein